MEKRFYLLVCVFVLLSSYLAYAAPPSFHIINGYVFCEGDLSTPLTGYVINDTVDNGTNQFNLTGSISDEGEYLFIINADVSYTNYIYIDNVEVANLSYVVFGIENEYNLTTNSDLYCSICGDNIIQGGEQCEGTNLSGASCTSLGHDGGTLYCYPVGHSQECMFNQTQCTDDSPVDPGDPDDEDDDNDIPPPNNPREENQDDNSSDQDQEEEQENLDGGVETFPVNPSGDVVFWFVIGLFVVILGVMGFLFYKKYRKKIIPLKKT